MDKSRALIIKDKGVLEYVELEKPQIRPYEVLYRTQSCSLCTVEQRTYLGTRNYGYPFLGGHESAGIVEAVGEGVVGFEVGDKVVFTSAYCNQCVYCHTGRGTQCLLKKKLPKRINFEGSMLGGGLSEYLAIPAWQLIKVPDDANLDHVALTEPLACCIHSIEKANIKTGETVVIIGMGIMGLLHLKLAKMKGARVIVSEVNDLRRQKALNNGADIAINPIKESFIDKIKEYTNNLGADVVFNTIPIPSVWKEAISILAPYGRLIAYSSQDESVEIGVDFGKVHGKEFEFIGTTNPTMENNLNATWLIANKVIDMEEVIDSRFAFDEGIEAFKRAIEPDAYRVIIKY
ncbi:MAG: zinc-binding dehydrogenase [Thermoanaerobacteraceae bacterium]|uniref:zinc-dependent alcohol dehydrogenase n=1 Tax=Tepidimicrobium xylanilyticum TaxID=1123352 RepID=UPI0017EE36D2|nr:zinc-binding dehydrogenase [Tepidimicrobium xylanilyticum]NLZ54638.1 zinc-binding dehydrogenase [Thermoanaerobacteraceae bacterium]GMG95358.1 zinc-binding dehydrogenase [Tepidimicrobium xylanilyticum]